MSIMPLFEYANFIADSAFKAKCKKLDKLHEKAIMAYQKTLAIRDYLAFTLRSASTECIHKTRAIDRKTT